MRPEAKTPIATAEHSAANKRSNDLAHVSVQILTEC